jgi:hypothetical protein
MRTTLLALVFSIALLSCNKKTADTETNTVDSTAVTTPAEAEPAQEQTAEAPTAPLSPVDSIELDVARINAANLHAVAEDFVCDEKVNLIYYYDGKTIVKITIDWGTVGDASHKEEFFYQDNKLIFDYDLVEGAGAYPGGDSKLERRHYVVNDKVVQYTENKVVKPCEHCGYKASSKPYKILVPQMTPALEKWLCTKGQ